MVCAHAWLLACVLLLLLQCACVTRRYVSVRVSHTYLNTVLLPYDFAECQPSYSALFDCNIICTRAAGTAALTTGAPTATVCDADNVFKVVKHLSTCTLSHVSLELEKCSTFTFFFLLFFKTQYKWLH